LFDMMGSNPMTNPSSFVLRIGRNRFGKV
jgi:hypothetical protein